LSLIESLTLKNDKIYTISLLNIAVKMPLIIIAILIIIIIIIIFSIFLSYKFTFKKEKFSSPSLSNIPVKVQPIAIVILIITIKVQDRAADCYYYSDYYYQKSLFD